MCGSTPNTVLEAPPAPAVQVAVGVITAADGRVLISRRPPGSHQGGLWEFPGGKLEAGESVPQALQRELAEELGVQVQAAEPLIRIPWQYPDKSVVLEVWRVNAYAGEPHAREGQPLQWLRPEALLSETFPAANRPIISALQLPEQYLISGPFGSTGEFLRRLQASLDAGIRLLQLRLPAPLDRHMTLLEQAIDLCHGQGCRVLVNCAPDAPAARLGDGIHLNSRHLMQCQSRPVAAGRWLSAAIHNLAELQQARNIGVDIGLISPVKPTASHPEAVPLGWAGFARLAEAAPFPVYALGGMSAADLPQARQAGAQGIAGIGFLWR